MGHNKSHAARIAWQKGEGGDYLTWLDTIAIAVRFPLEA